MSPVFILCLNDSTCTTPAHTHTRAAHISLLLPVYFAHHGLDINRRGGGGGLDLFLLLLLPEDDGMDARAPVLSVLLQLGRARKQKWDKVKIIFWVAFIWERVCQRKSDLCHSNLCDAAFYGSNMLFKRGYFKLHRMLFFTPIFYLFYLSELFHPRLLIYRKAAVIPLRLWCF